MEVALVVGCARSGTSILVELIAAHPSVSYVFEAHQVWECAGSGSNQSHRLTAEAATPEVREAIAGWFARNCQKGGMVVEKNPRNALRVPYIRTIFPEARIVHIVRDGRDPACSMVAGCGGNTWNHLRPPSWERLMHEQEGAVRCALAWKEVLEIALDYLQDLPPPPVSL